MRYIQRGYKLKGGEKDENENDKFTGRSVLFITGKRGKLKHIVIQLNNQKGELIKETFVSIVPSEKEQKVIPDKNCLGAAIVLYYDDRGNVRDKNFTMIFDDET